MAIRWDKFTVKSQEAMQTAGTLAAENGNPELLPLHILAVLLEDKDGIIVPLLQKVGVPTEQLLTRVNQALAGLPKVSGAGAQPSLSQTAQRVVDKAFKEAQNFKDDYVSTEHLLLALTQEKNDPAQLALAAAGATHDTILRGLTSVRGSQRVTDQNPEAKYQAPTSMPKISPSSRAAASSTRSSAATKRFAASSRCSPAAPRTIRCSSASPAWARPPSSRTRPPHRLGRRARDPARQARRLARPRLHARRREISR